MQKKKKPAVQPAQRGSGIKINKDAVIKIGSVAAIIIILLAWLIPGREIEIVEVRYLGDAGITAANLGYSDEDIIRLSKVRGEKYSDKLKLAAGNAILTSGYFIMEDLKEVDNGCVEIVVSARKPLAVISSGGKYVTVDEERYVLKVSSVYDEKTEPVLVQGVSLMTPVAGLQVNPELIDEKFDNALAVAKVIRDRDYRSCFTAMTMQEKEFVTLSTSRGIPVRISMRFDFADDLALAREILAEDPGLKKCTLEVVNGHGYVQPDDNGNYSIRGM